MVRNRVSDVHSYIKMYRLTNLNIVFVLVPALKLYFNSLLFMKCLAANLHHFAPCQLRDGFLSVGC